MFPEWLHKLGARLRLITRRRQLDCDLDDEVAFHLAMRAERERASASSAREADYAARRKLGNVTSLKEVCREMWTFVSLESLLQDVRYALRTLGKSLGFTVVAILTLALGIGANTAIFSVVDGVLLRPLPYHDPQQLFAVRQNESLMNLSDIQRQVRFFSQCGGINVEDMDYTSGTEPVQIHGGYVDAGFLETLGVAPMFGRTISREDDAFGGPRVIVASYSFWQNFLGGAPDALGRTVALSGNDYTVIGVMPQGFQPPRERADLYVALRVAYPDAAKYRGVHFMRTYWRLRPGVTPSQAQAELSQIDRQIAEQFPDTEKTRNSVLISLQDYVVGDARTGLLVLFGAVAFVLLIACANFAGLLVARSVARRQELVIRASLGAGRLRLVRQALVESALLSLAGGGAGLLVAKWGTPLLLSLKPAELARFTGVRMDARVLLFVFAVSLMTGIVFGIAPAWTAASTDFSESLKEGGRTATSGVSGFFLRKLLVAGEFALAVVLLVGAGLLIRGFSRLRAVHPGFNPQNVLTMHLQLPASRYADIPPQTQFRRDVLARLTALPGVAAAMITDIPFGDNYLDHKFVIEGRPPMASGSEPEVQTLSVMGDYFRVMQIPVIAGRAFTGQDREGQPLVAVVNEALVRKFFPHENPLGARIDWALAKPPRKWMAIVGVVHDAKYFGLNQPVDPAVYAPYSQSDEAWRRWSTLAIRSTSSSVGLISEVKKQVWNVDGRIPVSDIQSMDELMAVSLAQQRFNMVLLDLFAALALLLAAIGIYGLMSYTVSQRAHEIGIRVAIGAQRRDVLALVVAEGGRLAFVGILVGIAFALALTRLMSSLLFEVSPTDPATFATVAFLLASVALLACYLPARRATRVDPIVALRYE